MFYTSYSKSKAASHKKVGTHNDTCGLCGCKIALKAKWATTECPDKPARWPEIKEK